MVLVLFSVFYCHLDSYAILQNQVSSCHHAFLEASEIQRFILEHSKIIDIASFYYSTLNYTSILFMTLELSSNAMGVFVMRWSPVISYWLF